MPQEPRISGRKKKLIPKKASEDKEEEEVVSGSSIGGQDDQSGGSQDASVSQLSQPSKDELKLWPVLIEGKTVWVEFDTKPSPEVRVAQLM